MHLETNELKSKAFIETVLLLLPIALRPLEFGLGFLYT